MMSDGTREGPERITPAGFVTAIQRFLLRLLFITMCPPMMYFLQHQDSEAYGQVPER